MTYDERQEIEEWLRIIKKNCERLNRNIESLEYVLSNVHIEQTTNQEKENEDHDEERYS